MRDLWGFCLRVDLFEPGQGRGDRWEGCPPDRGGWEVGLLVDKDDLINYQLLIIYELLLRIFTYQPTVDKTILWMLGPHTHRQSTFPDNVSVPERVSKAKGSGLWGNVHREFVVSSVYVCVQSVRKNIGEDMEDRWVTNLSEDRKRFYLMSSLLDPPTKMNSFCHNKYFGRRYPGLSFNGLEKFLLVSYSGRSEKLGWTSQAS